jgi:hypothetical protein
MKTSNKILLGLIIVIFAVPLLLAAALKSKVRKGEYTVEKNKNSREQGNFRSGTFAAYKVVKVVSPNPELLTCKLTLSNKMEYSYYGRSAEDSVEVYAASDTLFIKYLATATNEKSRGYNEKLVRVHLPALTNLVVDGASVIIDSLPDSNNFSVMLKNNGEVKNHTEKTEQKAKSTTAGTKRREPIAETHQPKWVEAKGSKVVKANPKMAAPDFKELMIFRLL